MSSKKSLKEQIKKRISVIKDKDNIILFTNPNQFCKLKLERINPNHIGIIWGYRNRKQRKIRGGNWVKVAKIQFTELITFIGYNIQDKIIPYIEIVFTHANKTGIPLLSAYFMFSIGFFVLCFRLGK